LVGTACDLLDETLEPIRWWRGAQIPGRTAGRGD
jgi:hypothetical protein